MLAGPEASVTRRTSVIRNNLRGGREEEKRGLTFGARMVGVDHIPRDTRLRGAYAGKTPGASPTVLVSRTSGKSRTKTGAMRPLT